MQTIKYPMTRDELMQWAADNDVVQNCEGTPAESLMAGWVNAMDMQDARKGAMSDDEFVRVCFSEFCNMGYDKL